MPALKKTLEPLAEGGAELTTGSMITDGRRLLFATRLRDDRLECFGIGGRPRPREDLAEALIREGREEAGLSVSPRDSSRTLFCVTGDRPEAVSLNEDLSPRPCLVWREDLPGPGGGMAMLSAVWEACVGSRDRPWPGAEIRRLVWLYPERCLNLSSPEPEIIGPGILPVPEMVLIGTAGFMAAVLRGVPIAGLQLERAFQRGRALLESHGAGSNLAEHSRKVALVALSLGRRLAERGAMIDVADLCLAALLHDIGKTPGGRCQGGEDDHAEASAEVLRAHGLAHLSGPVSRHMVTACLEPEWHPGWLEAVLFYADKVVADRYLGLERRLSDMAHRHRGLACRVEAARKPLLALEERLAGAAGLDRPRLKRLLYAAQLHQGWQP